MSEVESNAFTPDQIVSQIFAIQNERNPQEDPGDISIDVQDDSSLHAIHQNDNIIGFGSSIQEALENALSIVKEGTERIPYYQRGIQVV